MTLIVSVISKNFIVQTVDRKITKGQANLDYDRDKLILCNCRGARFSVAFTGDASAYNAPASSGSRNIVFPEETQTAPWVAATLSNLSRDCDSLESVLEGFEQAVNKTYKPPNAGIAIFIFTGYKYLQVGTEQIVVPFWTTINNGQLTHQTYRSKVVWTSVDPNLFSQEQSPVLHVQIDGMLPAVSESSSNDFLEIVHQATLLSYAGPLVSDEAVHLIQEAHKNKTYGRYIGQQCNSIAFGPQVGLGYDPQYYDHYGMRHAMTPLIVTSSGFFSLKLTGSNPQVLKMLF